MADTIAEMSVKVTLDDKASEGLAKVGEKFDKSGSSSKLFSDRVGGAATSLAAVGTQVDKAMNLMDRYEITQLTVANANLQVERAQDTLNRAIAQYGTNSVQAVTASKTLETAQNSLEAANIRADSSMVMIGISAMTMVQPMLKGAEAFGKFANSGTIIAQLSATFISSIGAMRTAFVAFSTFMLTNPIGIALTVIAGALGVYYYATQKAKTENDKLTASHRTGSSALTEIAQSEKNLANMRESNASLMADIVRREDELFHARQNIKPLTEAVEAAESSLAKKREASVSANSRLADAENDYKDALNESARASDELADAEGDLAELKADMIAKAASARLAEAEKNYNDTKERSKTAAENLKDAEDRLSAARQSLIGYTQDLDDAEDRLAGASLDVRQARLDLTDAQENYNKVLADSEATTDDVERAQIRLERAILRLEEATENADEATENLTDVQGSAATRADELTAAEEALTGAKDELADAAADEKTAEDLATQAKINAVATGSNPLQEAEDRVKSAKDDVKTATDNMKAAESDLKDARLIAMQRSKELKDQEDELKAAKDLVSDADSKLKALEDELSNVKHLAEEATRHLKEEEERHKTTLEGVNVVVGTDSPAAYGNLDTALKTNEQGYRDWKDVVTEQVDSVVEAQTTGFSNVVSTISGDLDDLAQSVYETWVDIKNAASTTWTDVMDIFANVTLSKAGVQSAWNNVGSWLTEKWNSFKTSAQSAWNAIQSVWDRAFTPAPTPTGSGGGSQPTDVWWGAGDKEGWYYLGDTYWALPGTESTMDTSTGSGSENKTQLIELLKSTGRYKGPATTLAEGGIVSHPTTALIGEAGPEAVIPLSKMNSGGGVGGITINFNAPIYGVNDLQAAIDNALNRVKWNIGRLGA